MTVTLNKQVQLLRYHSMEIRRLRARIVNAQVRNSSTRAAILRHETARKSATKTLVDLGLRELTGLLVEEANLRQRMQGKGYSVELQYRLDSVLQDIRQYMAGVGTMPLPLAASMVTPTSLRTSPISR